jgi:hypothetical protein
MRESRINSTKERNCIMVSQARDKRRRWNGRTERKGEAGERSNRTRVRAWGVLMGTKGAVGEPMATGRHIRDISVPEDYSYASARPSTLSSLDRVRTTSAESPAPCTMIIIQKEIGHVQLRLAGRRGLPQTCSRTGTAVESTQAVEAWIGAVYASAADDEAHVAMHLPVATSGPGAHTRPSPLP